MHLIEALSRAVLKVTQQLLESELNSGHRVTVAHSTRLDTRPEETLRSLFSPLQT